MTLQEIEDAASAALTFVEKVAPMAALGGPAAATVGGVIGEVASLGEVFIQRSQEAANVAVSTSLQHIQAVTDKLRTENDALAQQVQAS